MQQYLVATSPKFMSKWRIYLLKSFGARIGKGCYIAPSVHVVYPWKLVIGDGVSIDERCYLQGNIQIGSHISIGNNVHMVSEGHNVRSRYFEFTDRPIYIGHSCFIGGDAYIARGVRIGDFSVVGAKSVVWHDVPENTIAYGNPCVNKDSRISETEFYKYTY